MATVRNRSTFNCRECQTFQPLYYIVAAASKRFNRQQACVQGFEKLCRGGFASSPRVTTFLSLVSRYQVKVSHLSGRANILSDFTSRNVPLCIEPNCQIFCFISRTEDFVVRSVSIHDVLKDETRLPFTTISAWGSIQSECADLGRTHAHLKQGTRPVYPKN